ncbi:PAS domain S-box protein [Dactylosporangium salmoneum]|uniref:histidine kinase n=1 Tax=Dactylosporangium salmoneum TaxID=53361 RepID=A0ABN3GWH7_9ACTN
MVQQSQPRRDAYPDYPDETVAELDRLRHVLADAPDAFVSLDEGGCVLEWNAAATRMTGWRADEVIGRPFAGTLLPAEYRAGLLARLARFLRADGAEPSAAEPVELELVHRGGHRVPVEATVWPAWRYGRCYAFLRDVRDRRETAQQKAFLGAVLENLSDAVVACDGAGELTVFNPAAERMHGLPAEPLPPQRWAERYDLLNPDGTPMRTEDVPLFRALHGEPVAGVPILIAPRGQPVRSVVASGRQLRDERGRVLGAVVSMRDVGAAAAAQQRAERHNRALVATIEAQRAVTAAVHDRAEVLRVVADRAVAAFPAADGAVVELLVTGDALEYAAAAGTLQPHVGTVLKLAGSLSGLAMAAGVTVRCSDTGHDARVNAEACRRTGIGSMCIAPLYAAQQAIGVLKVSSRTLRAFDEADEQQLELLAASLSGALRHAEDYGHNARLLQERTEALAALEVSERRFRLSFDNSPVGMLLIDLRPAKMGRFLQANPMMSEITGYRHDELTAMTYADLAHSDNLPDIETTIDKLTSGGIETATVERRYRHKTGRTTWVTARVGVIRDTTGRPSSLVAQIEDITQRRAAQARLEQQARLLQLIPAPVIVHDLDGTVRSWNDGAEATYGHRADAAVGRRIHELLALDERDGTATAVTAALLRDGHWTGELTYRGADGRTITVLSRQVLHRGLADPDDLDEFDTPGGTGQRAAVLQVDTDITALRAAEQAVSASEQRLRAQFVYSGAGQVLRAPDGTWLEANPAFAAMLGTTPDRLVGMNVNDLMHPDDLPGSMANVSALLAGDVESVTSEGRLHRVDGGWMDYHSTISAVRDAAGRPLYLVVVVTDITDRRSAERARDAAAAQLAQRNVELAAERAYLNEILDIINVYVMTCDRDGNLVHLNRAGRSVPVGPPPTRIEHLHRVAPAGLDPAPDNHPLAQALRGEVIEAAQMVLHADTGRDRALIVDARPLQDPDGRPAGAICTAFDVTALRDREAELAGFAGVVAHDLKNPLTGIIGFAEMAADLLDEAGTGRGLGTAARYVTRVKENAQHMDQLIDDLLAFATARDAPLRPGWADLSAMVNHIVMVRTGHLPPPDRPDIAAADLPTVWADPGMLRQVLDNLVGNAVKYTRPGSRAEVTVSAERGPAQVCIRVADRGIGIPADQRQKVLSQFHRAHTSQGYAGTGLGLAICQRVIDRHGGTIEIAENPGGGTLVTVTLPQPS